MKIKAAFVLFYLLIISNFAYCQKGEFHYLKNGISFTLSDKWKIIADEPIPETGHYFSVEKIGKNATGLFTLIWMDKTEDPTKVILAQQESMKNTNLYRNPGIEFTAIQNDSFVGNDCKKVNYATIINGQKIEGSIWCFNCTERTLIVFFQSGLDDRKKNLQDFSLIQQTFGCR